MRSQRPNPLPARFFFLTFFLLVLGIIFLAVSRAPVAQAGWPINVNTTVDEINPNDNTCSLREAIIAANNNTHSGGLFGECDAGSPGLDTINLPAGTYVLTRTGMLEDNSTTGDLDVLEDLVINGEGSSTTKVDGNSIDRVFEVLNSADATLTNLTIQLGNAHSEQGGGIHVRSGSSVSLSNVLVIANYAGGMGGGLYVALGASATLSVVGFANNSAFYGGGIYNDGSLSISRGGLSWNNTASTDGGAIENAGTATLTDVTISNSSAPRGGGIYHGGTWMELTRVTMNNNQATVDYGGAIYTNKPVTLTNVTLSGNTAHTSGGALYKTDFWPNVTLLHTTIYSNSAASGGGIFRAGTQGKVAFTSSIIAGNTGGNCSGSTSSTGYNMDSGNTCFLGAAGDMSNTDPLLGPLGMNGGATETHPLLLQVDA